MKLSAFAKQLFEQTLEQEFGGACTLKEKRLLEKGAKQMALEASETFIVGNKQIRAVGLMFSCFSLN